MLRATGALKNPSLVDEIDSLGPITKMRVGNLTNEDTPAPRSTVCCRVRRRSDGVCG